MSACLLSASSLSLPTWVLHMEIINEVPGIPTFQRSVQPVPLESRLMLAFLSGRNVQVSFLDKTFRLQTLLQSNRTFAKTAGNLSRLVFLLNHFTHTHSLRLSSNFTSPLIILRAQILSKESQDMCRLLVLSLLTRLPTLPPPPTATEKAELSLG